MKVSRTSKAKKTSQTKKPITSREIPRISFTEVLNVKEEDKQREVLEEILDAIKDKGRRLSENRTVESLYEYKKMVKDFVEDAVEYGLKISERRGFSRAGRSKIMRTVSSVDDKLLELTDIILKQETKQLNILKKVGEIEGLLINLFI